MWFDPTRQHDIREEAARYGEALIPTTAYQTMRWFTGGELRGEPGVSVGEQAGLEAALAAMRDAARELAGASREELRRHDVSVREWLDRLEIGPETRDYLYAWTSTMAGAAPDDHPMLAILQVLAQKEDAYTVGVTRNRVFAKGTTELAEAIAADVRGEIRLNCPVTAIRQSDDGVEVETRGGPVSGRLCILAIPINTMGEIAFEPPLEPERQEAIEQGNVCQVQKVWMLARGVPDRLMAYGWNTPLHSVSAEGGNGDTQLVVGFALNGRIDPADTGALEEALRVYAPEAKVVAAMHHDWSGDPWARGGWMSEPPGWVVDGVLDMLARPHGRVLMAGADIALEYPGWITGAIHSGRRAADEGVRVMGDG
jgi:monoamine oxidase